MKSIFDEVKIGTMILKNRIIRSATFEGMTKDGTLTEEYGKLYEELARGGVGLIITGMAGVDELGVMSDTQICTYLPDFEKNLEQIVKRVHQFDSKIVVQLNHCGVKAGIFQPKPSVGPMEIPGKVHGLSETEIKGICEDFVEAARKCKKAGADGVQIHAAHGFLMNQFLSPHYNKRTDSYGGSLENRTRFLIKVCKMIRKELGETYPILIKLNQDDLVEDGLKPEEMTKICQMLEKENLVDAIELSCGVMESRETMAFLPISSEGYNAFGAASIASKVKLPVICVGGIRSVAFMEHILNTTNIEGFSLCRPLVREADLVNKWKENSTYKAECNSCGACFGLNTLFCHQIEK